MTVSDPGERRPLWRNRDFVVLWSGELVSVVGTGISQISYPLLVLALTHSPVQAGIVGALRVVPYLFLGLPAGALVDRWNRKRVMILCDAGRGLNMASMPLALWLGHLTVAQLYLNSVVGGALFVLFSAAQATYLPHVVSPDQVPAGAAAEQAMSSAASVVSPPLGGLLFQLGQSIPFLSDALSYAASVLALLFVRTEFQEQRGATARNLRREIAEGIRFLWNHPVLRFVYLATGALSLGVSSIALVAIVLARGEHASAAAIGVMFSATGIGGFVGSLVAPRVQRQLGIGGIIIAASWSMALLWPLLALAPTPMLLGMALGALAFVIPVHGVAVVSYRLAATPDRLRGRVASVARVIAWSTEPAGMALSGLFLQQIGAMQTALLLAGWSLLIATAASLYAPLRRVGLPEQPRAAEPVSERVYICSFCGKQAAEVRWMIAGKSGAIICDECVRRSEEIMAEADGRAV